MDAARAFRLPHTRSVRPRRLEDCRGRPTGAATDKGGSIMRSGLSDYNRLPAERYQHQGQQPHKTSLHGLARPLWPIGGGKTGSLIFKFGETGPVPFTRRERLFGVRPQNSSGLANGAKTKASGDLSELLVAQLGECARG